MKGNIRKNMIFYLNIQRKSVGVQLIGFNLFENCYLLACDKTLGLVDGLFKSCAIFSASVKQGM